MLSHCERGLVPLTTRCNDGSSSQALVDAVRGHCAVVDTRGRVQPHGFTAPSSTAVPERAAAGAPGGENSGDGPGATNLWRVYGSVARPLHPHGTASCKPTTPHSHGHHNKPSDHRAPLIGECEVSRRIRFAMVSFFAEVRARRGVMWGVKCRRLCSCISRGGAGHGRVPRVPILPQPGRPARVQRRGVPCAGRRWRASSTRSVVVQQRPRGQPRSRRGRARVRLVVHR